MNPHPQPPRNELFHKLKPICVTLSQLALGLRSGESAEGVKKLRLATAELLTILTSAVRHDATALDGKLADYVFFPLSHVLRHCQKDPGLLAESAVGCVQILLKYGWRHVVSLELAVQLLLLLTAFAGGANPTTSLVLSEELKTVSFSTLAALFDGVGSAPGGSARLIDAQTMPTLAHCLTTILEGIVAGSSFQMQLAALAALRSFWLCIKDLSALSAFLPGTVSALVKALLPTTSAPRTRRVLVAGIQALDEVLRTCLNDLRTRNLPAAGDGDGGKKKLTKSWLSATSSQIKLALANVVKLSKSNDKEVREELERMCLHLLDECQESLSDAAPLLVETAMLISSEADGTAELNGTSLSDLAMIHPSIVDLIKSTIYSWVQSFPRIMQANDEDTKRAAIRQLFTSHNLAKDLDLGSDTLQISMTRALRDGVSNLIEVPKSTDLILDIEAPGTMLLLRDSSMNDFPAIILPQGPQSRLRNDLQHLLASIGTSASQNTMAYGLLPAIEASSGRERLACFWLSFQLTKASLRFDKDLHDFVLVEANDSTLDQQVMDDLYTLSLSLLEDTEPTDWRLRAIAMEVITTQAELSRHEFRADLVDALYPIVQELGTPHAALRDHAIVALNKIATACDYVDTSQLIIQNADYLVNAISLKLNTFNIAPQAPQVLIMMIKLSGPTLLPYLDDVVASIFAALHNYHGYPRLVEALFSVLSEIIDAGAKSEQFSLMSGHIDHRKVGPAAPSINDVVAAVQRTFPKDIASDPLVYLETPRKPWKSAQVLLDEAAVRGHDKSVATNPDIDMDDTNNEPEHEDTETQALTTPTPQPNPTAYKTLHAITSLTQYHLSHSSAPLRLHLLTLLQTSLPLLSRDENTFLPLINVIWPVLVRRLYDEEVFVVVEAAGAVGEVFRGAGDFMSTRVVEMWGPFVGLLKGVAKGSELGKGGVVRVGAKMGIEARSEGKKAAARAGSLIRIDNPPSKRPHAQAHRLRTALLDLAITLLQHVRISDEMFDELLEVLGTEITDDAVDGDGNGNAGAGGRHDMPGGVDGGRGDEGAGGDPRKAGNDLRKAFEAIPGGADAVWLYLWGRRRDVAGGSAKRDIDTGDGRGGFDWIPQMEGHVFATS